MNWNSVIHAAGWLCLIVMAATAVYTIVATVAPQWRRILRLASGHIEFTVAPPSPAASDAPHASAPLPQRRGVEAAAAPAFQVRG